MKSRWGRNVFVLGALGLIAAACGGESESGSDVGAIGGAGSSGGVGTDATGGAESESGGRSNGGSADGGTAIGGDDSGAGGEEACCLAFPTCGPGETEIASAADCPEGASCYENHVCCSTIWCAQAGDQCNAIPSCPGDSVEVDSCPPSNSCVSQTLCGSSILCWSDSSVGWSLPPNDASFDYQIGEAYEPPVGVEIVSRDREASPAVGLYNFCYINGFQTQPQDNDTWLSDNPELLVPGADGEPLLDEDWGEYLLDVSTQEKRAQLLAIVGPWIEGCARDGFDAIEVDNLDSYSRSGGYLRKEDAVSFLAELSAIAHGLGLAVGQKNSAELLDSVEAMGTDFAIAEECNRYDECGEYQNAYQDRVFIIEYRQEDFDAGCAEYPELSIVFRDLNVSGPGANGYIYDGC